MKDAQYRFYAKGVGKVAEVESLNVVALLVQPMNENENTGKVLVEAPER